MADKQLSGKKVVLVVPRTQFREEEVFEPQRILEKAGVEILVVSGKTGTCRGMRDGIIEAAASIDDVKPEEFDGIIIAGGSSVPTFFWKNKALVELAAAMSEAGKVVAAISLSTVVLAKANLLEGKDATVYYLPEAIEELKSAGARYVSERLIVNGNIVMAEGPAEARSFSNAIVAALAQ